MTLVEVTGFSRSVLFADARDPGVVSKTSSK